MTLLERKASTWLSRSKVKESRSSGVSSENVLEAAAPLLNDDEVFVKYPAMWNNKISVAQWIRELFLTYDPARSILKWCSYCIYS